MFPPLDQQPESGARESSGAQEANVQDGGGQGGLPVQDNRRSQFHIRGTALPAHGQDSAELRGLNWTCVSTGEAQSLPGAPGGGEEETPGGAQEAAEGGPPQRFLPPEGGGEAADPRGAAQERSGF